MPFLVALALKWGWSRGAAKLFSWGAPAVVLIAIVGGGIALIYGKGVSAGGAKVEAKVEKAHAKVVADAKGDGEKAQGITDAIGNRVSRIDDKTTALVRSKITEMHDAIDATPPAPVGAPPALFPADRVSASLNTLIDSANRAAASADAERGDDQDGAPGAD